MTTNNSLGAISTCKSGEEKYTTFRLTPRARKGGRNLYTQYEYRDPQSNELFSCVGSTLERCREKRDEWLNKKYANTHNCKHYTPANYANCATCKIGGYCNMVCDNFEYREDKQQ